MAFFLRLEPWGEPHNLPTVCKFKPPEHRTRGLQEVTFCVSESSLFFLPAQTLPRQKVLTSTRPTAWVSAPCAPSAETGPQANTMAPPAVTAARASFGGA